MAADQSEFALRRERLALRAHIANQDSALINTAPESTALKDTAQKDIDIGNFAAAQVGSTLWISATPVAQAEQHVSALAAALAWQARSQRTDGAVQRIRICDAVAPGLTARRAAYFSLPIDVLDTRSTPAMVAAPMPHQQVVAPHPDHLAFVSMLDEAGSEVVVEHGVVAGEVMGLEVARVIDEDGVAKLRIGVGAHDREMFKMLHGDVSTVEQLQKVVNTVRNHRQIDAPTHPLNLLAAERAVRSRAIAAPQSLGLLRLRSVEPPLARPNLKDVWPCCALGVDDAGTPTVVVFVSGVDLDIVPFAADARDRLAPAARLLIVTQQRNVLPLQKQIAELLVQPAEFVSA